MINAIKNILADEKSKVAILSIISNTVLVLLKLFAGIITGSVSILSEAIHSSLDLLAAVIAFVSVRISRLPPDDKHRYGHGKAENISGTIEALLIFVAAVWIIVEAYDKLVNGAMVETVTLGIIVMAISALVNIFVSSLLMKVAKRTDSVALEADAMHLRTDVYTSVGVLAGLGILQLTHIQMLDPLIAIAVALLIIKAAYDLTIKAFRPLMDVALSSQEEARIIEILNSVESHSVLGYHQLRTRRSGAERYIDLHLVISRHLTVEESHQLCDQLERKIESELPLSNVLIHVDPCTEDQCTECTGCPHRVYANE